MIPLALWLTWCLINLLSMALVIPQVPAYTGFRIVMPAHLAVVLTLDEYRAVYAHELGHKHYRHAWRNFARVCIFWFPSKARLAAQEQQADDFAVELGYAIPLARALRKLSRSPTDWERAKRLEMIGE